MVQCASETSEVQTQMYTVIYCQDIYNSMAVGMCSKNHCCAVFIYDKNFFLEPTMARICLKSFRNDSMHVLMFSVPHVF